MRCLFIGNFGTSWDSSICDEEHIAEALEHELQLSPFGEYELTVHGPPELHLVVKER